VSGAAVLCCDVMLLLTLHADRNDLITYLKESTA
jgi:hypothetical protein